MTNRTSDYALSVRWSIFLIEKNSPYSVSLVLVGENTTRYTRSVYNIGIESSERGRLALYLGFIAPPSRTHSKEDYSGSPVQITD